MLRQYQSLLGMILPFWTVGDAGPYNFNAYAAFGNSLRAALAASIFSMKIP